MMAKIKFDLEKIMLAVFLVIILSLGPGTLFDHKIKHDFPFAYLASDSFQHQVRAEAIKDMGNFKYEAVYISKGFENAEGRYPPVLYHLAVILSHAAGIEVFDSIYFIVVFFMIIAGLIMYFIIKNFNKTVALISLPLSLLVFSSPPSTGFLWGHWPSLLSQSFLVLLFWSIAHMNLRKFFIIISLGLSAVFLTHSSELVFGLIFLAIFFGTKLISRNLSKNDIKIMLLAFISFFIISFYYIVIFANTWAKAQPYIFTIRPIWDGNPGFYIAGFGLLLIPMILGAVFSIFRIKNIHVVMALGFAMLLSGFMNYVGFDTRAFQIRFFWPIYLSVFLGFGTYTLLKLLIKKWNFIYTSVIFIVFIVLISGLVKLPIITQNNVQTIPSFPFMNLNPNPGMMNALHWESLKWISDNTDDDAKIYFFYGDIYSQDALLRNSKRVHSQVDPGNFIQALQERKIKRNYVTELPGDNGGGIMIRKSFFNFENAQATKPADFFFGPKDICTFNYYVFDKVSRQEVLAQYNILIAQEMLKNEFIRPVFENDFVFILKNNNLGADCIEERTF